MDPLVIRPLTRSDRAAVAFAFAHLGENSRYQRYLTGMPRLPPRELQRLLSVDHWHHEALIAWSSLPRKPVGITEYVRLEDFDLAEVAVAVVDDWQRRGVGRALMTALSSRAAAAGVRWFTASMLSSNKGAIALARELAPGTTFTPEDDLLAMRLELGRR
jgi:acetyltransferase